MKPMTWKGPFTAHAQADGSWRLSGPGEPPVQILLSGLQPADISGEPILGVTLTWVGDQAEVQMQLSGQTRRINAATALAHESRGDIYRRLPLADFEFKGRQFWKRIFWLVRIPGAGLLLGFLARRSRS
jgi:hypothetical protein